MRGLVRSLRIFGVVLIPFIGCGDSQEEACNICESCEGVVCPPDENQCTRGQRCFCGECFSIPVKDGTGCTYDGLSGVCVQGVCGKNLCEGVVCGDDDACTHYDCDYVDGGCHVTPTVCNDYNECTEDGCDPADGCKWTPVEDGRFCSEGVCRAGACVLPTDACTNAADLAAVCDPGFADEVGTCARDALGNPRATARCLVENTGVSADCASCYGACLVGNGCGTMFASCTGDLASACDTGGTMFDVGAFEVQP